MNKIDYCPELILSIQINLKRLLHSLLSQLKRKVEFSWSCSKLISQVTTKTASVLSGRKADKILLHEQCCYETELLECNSLPNTGVASYSLSAVFFCSTLDLTLRERCKSSLIFDHLRSAVPAFWNELIGLLIAALNCTCQKPFTERTDNLRFPSE
jgi:hypothetical protein